MKEIIYKCDRCGKLITGKVYYIDFEPFYDQSDGMLAADDRKIDVEEADFCDSCINEIFEFIRQKPIAKMCAKADKLLVAGLEAGIQAAAAPDDPEETAAPEIEAGGVPEVKPKTRKKVDYGKIMALHNAGWDRKQIAEEMGMTENAVYQAMLRYKKSQEPKE